MNPAHVLLALAAWLAVVLIVTGWIENRRDRWIADIDRHVKQRVWQ